MKYYIVIFTSTDYHCIYVGTYIIEAYNREQAIELARKNGNIYDCDDVEMVIYCGENEPKEV